MTADSITLTTPADMAAAVHLRVNSALHGCAKIEWADDGGTFVPRYPVTIWSSGERMLWAAMTTLANGYKLTAYDLDQAASVLDAFNATILREAVMLWANVRGLDVAS
jgi:hypothetical protein